MTENDQSKEEVYDELRQHIARNKGRVRIDEQPGRVAVLRVAFQRKSDAVGNLLASSLMLWLAAVLVVLFTGVAVIIVSQPSPSSVSAPDVTISVDD